MARPEFDYPDPNIEGQILAAIAASNTFKAHIAYLHETGVNKAPSGPELIAEMTLTHGAEMRDRVYTIGRTAGVHAVAHGLLSRAEVGRLLDRHEQTIGAWVNDAKLNPQPDRDYTVDYFSAVARGHQVHHA